MTSPPLNRLLAELRRVLFELQSEASSPDELRLAVRYSNAHLEQLGLKLVGRQRVDALEAITDAALKHAFLRWSTTPQAEIANQDLWAVCDAHQAVVDDLGPPSAERASPVVHHEGDPSPVVRVSWLGLELEFPARDGVAGQRERLSWVVVDVGEGPWVRLYCDHDLSQEFLAKPGQSWRPADSWALSWWVEAPKAVG